MTIPGKRLRRHLCGFAELQAQRFAAKRARLHLRSPSDTNPNIACVSQKLRAIPPAGDMDMRDHGHSEYRSPFRGGCAMPHPEAITTRERARSAGAFQSPSSQNQQKHQRKSAPRHRPCVIDRRCPALRPAPCKTTRSGSKVPPARGSTPPATVSPTPQPVIGSIFPRRRGLLVGFAK